MKLKIIIEPHVRIVAEITVPDNTSMAERETLARNAIPEFVDWDWKLARDEAPTRHGLFTIPEPVPTPDGEE